MKKEDDTEDDLEEGDEKAIPEAASGWKKRFDNVKTVLPLLGVLTYIIGTLIVTLDLHRYGISELGFLRARYVFVGATFAALFGLPFGIVWIKQSLVGRLLNKPEPPPPAPHPAPKPEAATPKLAAPPLTSLGPTTPGPAPAARSSDVSSLKWTGHPLISPALWTAGVKAEPPQPGSEGADIDWTKAVFPQGPSKAEPQASAVPAPKPEAASPAPGTPNSLMAGLDLSWIKGVKSPLTSLALGTPSPAAKDPATRTADQRTGIDSTKVAPLSGSSAGLASFLAARRPAPPVVTASGALPALPSLSLGSMYIPGMYSPLKPIQTKPASAWDAILQWIQSGGFNLVLLVIAAIATPGAVNVVTHRSEAKQEHAVKGSQSPKTGSGQEGVIQVSIPPTKAVSWSQAIVSRGQAIRSAASRIWSSYDLLIVFKWFLPVCLVWLLGYSFRKNQLLNRPLPGYLRLFFLLALLGSFAIAGHTYLRDIYPRLPRPYGGELERVQLLFKEDAVNRWKQVVPLEDGFTSIPVELIDETESEYIVLVPGKTSRVVPLRKEEVTPLY
jgi:hypothetical protein